MMNSTFFFGASAARTLATAGANKTPIKDTTPSFDSVDKLCGMRNVPFMQKEHLKARIVTYAAPEWFSPRRDVSPTSPTGRLPSTSAPSIMKGRGLIQFSRAAVRWTNCVRMRRSSRPMIRRSIRRSNSLSNTDLQDATRRIPRREQPRALASNPVAAANPPAHAALVLCVGSEAFLLKRALVDRVEAGADPTLAFDDHILFVLHVANVIGLALIAGLLWHWKRRGACELCGCSS